ncbi:MAG: hypothetical protein ACR2OZ_11225 [Verrucomicrobiales bacterium]
MTDQRLNNSRTLAAVLVLGLSSALFSRETAKSPGQAAAPLFREFVGINGHTVNFKPDLYAPVCRIVRDYHPVRWDLEGDTSRLPEWPFARNRVSWEKIYGAWHKAGLRISVCLMFDDIKVGDWKNLAADAHAYGRSFAENFGPGGKWPYVEWVEIGNEPGLYDDISYRALFEAMSSGLRAGNPRIKIVPCNIEVGPSERYWKGTDCLRGYERLYDALQIHRYAIAEQWPVWRRSYPEDAKVPFLSSIQKLLDWRDRNARGKPVWVTEFGWDSSTKKPAPGSEWEKWVGSTDEQQAQWIVRSFFLFAGMGVDKAFVFFFNDEDKPQLHAASGLTRNYVPKPAYHAVAWMLRSLANHRFSRAIRQSLDDGYVYELTPGKTEQPNIWAAWHPTKMDHEIVLDAEKLVMQKAEQMPLSDKPSPNDDLARIEGDRIRLRIGERPSLIWLARK